MPDTDVIQHSVTKDDYTTDAGNKGAVINFWINPRYGNLSGLPPTPPPYWSFARDDVLASSIHYEDQWANAVYIALTKMSSLGWRVKGPELKSRRTRELLLHVDADDGWAAFIQRHLRDYLLRDNGAFIEIVRATSAVGSRILGLVHLDSRRCTRTGDPDIPIIYRDRKQALHEMRSHQIIMLSDMPDPGDMWYGVGLSAASRAYHSIYRLASLEGYVSEKITGRRPLALHFVNNVSAEQIENAVRQTEDTQAGKGYTSWMGAVIVPNIDPTSTPAVATVDLAGLPDGFSPDEERLTGYLSYANALGLDPQELDPKLVGSKSIGSGGQSRVIDDKASGKGLIAWRENFVHILNEYVTPSDVTFIFVEKDYRDQLQQTQLEAQRTDIQVARIGAGLITPAQANQLLVDADDLPREFLMQPEMTAIVDLPDNVNPSYNPVGLDVALGGNSEAGLGTRDMYQTPDMSVKGSPELLTWEDIRRRGWLSKQAA